MENKITDSAKYDLHCKIYPRETLGDYKYVVICSRYQDQWLLSRHKNRNTYETQGGHVEPGETVFDAAARELYEESGVSDADLYYVCDYYGYDSNGHSNGAVFLALVHSLGKLPESEMAESSLFPTLPQNLTYPNVSPHLFLESEKFMAQIES